MSPCQKKVLLWTLAGISAMIVIWDVATILLILDDPNAELPEGMAIAVFLLPLLGIVLGPWLIAGIVAGFIRWMRWVRKQR